MGVAKLCLLGTCVTLALAQSVLGQLSFEVVSIKPAAPLPLGERGFRVHGGPGSGDPVLATFANIDLFSLTAMAYGIHRHQLVSPEWLAETRFDIMASVPPNTNQDQYLLMLQSLLADRFKLMLHREQRQLQIYELEVAKNGTKLKEYPAINDGLKPPPPLSAPPLGFQGAVNVVLSKASMERLASVLSGLLGEPVTDGTGLKGNYDVKLRALVASHSADAAASSDPDLFEALQEQLGLKLVRKKRLTSVLVIDHIEKTPTEN